MCKILNKKNILYKYENFRQAEHFLQRVNVLLEILITLNKVFFVLKTESKKN